MAGAGGWPKRVAKTLCDNAGAWLELGQMCDCGLARKVLAKTFIGGSLALKL
jgi:hypothetical protein